MKDTPRSSIEWVLFAAALCLPAVAAAAEKTSEDLSAEIVERCFAQVGEFGVEALHICVEQDTAAAKALEQYPQAVKSVVARCTREMEKGGWWIVKSCVDRDVEAAAALAEYPKVHEALLERCGTEMRGRGAAAVKACVDRAIEGQ
jgi:hypothetical protein